jgi:8-amino-7-oxononanoate synthase
LNEPLHDSPSPARNGPNGEVAAAGASLDDVAAARLAALERRRLRRGLATTERTSATSARRAGRDLVSFSCNDYLGLSQHPEVVAASIEATRRHGVGSGSSRLVNGNHPLYSDLERKLAELKGSEDAIVFGSGYLTNVGVIPALVGAADLVVIDELAHSCLLSGATLSRSCVAEFRHNDTAHAEALLAELRGSHRHCLLLTDGVFSMEGDLAPLARLAALASEHDSWLMTDDAHGLGVVGDGRGSSFAGSERVAVPLQMGTLSKAVGAYGGYLCASRNVVELLRNRARSFVYSTGLPPGTVAAASRALDIIATDRDLVRRPLALARMFTAELELPPAQSAIVAIVLGSAERALLASDALRAAGFLVAAIRPPTVPQGTSRLRFTFSAAHSEQSVRDLAAAVRATLAAH